MNGSADISGAYRYTLTRHWSSLVRGRRLLWVMLNPSTADHRQDDPTIRRCIAFSKRWGYTSLEVVNLFAFRSSSPLDLAIAGDPVGPRWEETFEAAAERADAAVLAWGSVGAGPRTGLVKEILKEQGVPMYVLARTKSGEPRHPLYIRGDTEPELIGGEDS